MKQKYTEYRTNWQRNKRNEQAKIKTPEKIKCNICGLYYKRPLGHVRQVHQLNEREYKEAFGLEHKKGIITEEAREKLREYVKQNYSIVVEKNLLKKGVNTRYKKGQEFLGKYKRSQETIKKLKEHIKRIRK